MFAVDPARRDRDAPLYLAGLRTGKHKASIHRRPYTTKRYQELYSLTANDVCFARRAAVFHFLPPQQKVKRKIHSANFAT